MNEEIMSKRIKVKRFSYKEFLIGLALLIGAAKFSQKGVQLFSFNHSSTASDDEDDGPGAEYWPSICPSPHFEQYMSFSHFKDFQRLLPSIWVDEDRKQKDPWYQFSPAIEEFNQLRATKVKTSRWITADESMSAWKPRKTSLGGLPNISFIIRKPETLGKSRFILKLKFISELY